MTPQTIVALAPMVAPRRMSVFSYRLWRLTCDAGIGDVGQHAGRAEKHVVLNHRPRVDGDVVLHLDVVADDHAAVDVHVLAEDAALADLRPLHDMAEVPDLGAGADLCAVVDVGRFVFEEGRCRGCRCC